jgi:nitrous oxidase accessory protein NosD
MATGAAAVAPSANISQTQITIAPVGSFADNSAKLLIESIGITPLPELTLQGHGQGIYVNINA